LLPFWGKGDKTPPPYPPWVEEGGHGGQQFRRGELGGGTPEFPPDLPGYPQDSVYI